MATLKIPAAYLNDVREAAKRDVKLDGELLADQEDQTELNSNIEILDRSLRVYRELLNATNDIELTAAQDQRSSPLGHMLEELVRVLAAKLDEAKEYGPLPMGDVLDIAEELRWAATEAIRINPDYDDRVPSLQRKAA